MLEAKLDERQAIGRAQLGIGGDRHKREDGEEGGAQLLAKGRMHGVRRAT